MVVCQSCRLEIAKGAASRECPYFCGARLHERCLNSADSCPKCQKTIGHQCPLCKEPVKVVEGRTCHNCNRPYHKACFFTLTERCKACKAPVAPVPSLGLR